MEPESESGKCVLVLFLSYKRSNFGFLYFYAFRFGDLNYRVKGAEELNGIGQLLENRVFRIQTDYQLLVKHDELKIEQDKGSI
jgi:hypothetical protein